MAHQAWGRQGCLGMKHFYQEKKVISARSPSVGPDCPTQLNVSQASPKLLQGSLSSTNSPQRLPIQAPWGTQTPQG